MKRLSFKFLPLGGPCMLTIGIMLFVGAYHIEAPLVKNILLFAGLAFVLAGVFLYIYLWKKS